MLSQWFQSVLEALCHVQALSSGCSSIITLTVPPLITFSDQIWLYNGPFWQHTSYQMHEVSVWLEQRHPLCSSPSHPGRFPSSHHSHFIFLFLKLSLSFLPWRCYWLSVCQPWMWEGGQNSALFSVGWFSFSPQDQEASPDVVAGLPHRCRAHDGERG